MRIKPKKSNKEAEEYKIEQDSIFTMTEQELDVCIDQIDNLNELKELVRKIAKLARHKSGNTRT
jgi:hypothetical protein